MADMKIDNISRIRFLDTDGERIGRVESISDQVPRRGGRRRRSTHNSGVNAKPQQSRIADVETNGMIAAGLGPLHQRHPLVIVGEELQVEIGRTRIGLRWNGQLGEDSLGGLGVAAETGADDGLLEALVHQIGVDVAGRRTGELPLGVEAAVAQQVAEVFKEAQQFFAGILVHVNHLQNQWKINIINVINIST